MKGARNAYYVVNTLLTMMMAGCIRWTVHMYVPVITAMIAEVVPFM